ncbi:MAG: hypothetical protein COT15_03525 [Candidatus Diapherotrites archaeon CG08_land_8_20_14_0_20_34_12]|nr:MAG: hypothetical protein COT15_03525 [Candidatus Diapherotrites archaeon CG08_land_8_20_14_0_20_34_12]
MKKYARIHHPHHKEKQADINIKPKKVDYKKFIPFVAKFFAISLAGTIILPLLDLNFLTNSIAKFVAYLSGVSVQGNTLLVNSNPLIITNMCIGLESVILLGAIIFSLKKPEFSKKIYSLALAGAFLIIANMLRILAIVGIAKIDYTLVDISHTISWFFTTAVIFAAWYVMSKKELEKNKLEELI